MPVSRRSWFVALAATVLLVPIGCSVETVDKSKSGSGAGETGPTELKEGEQPRIAYVTNGIASFWTVAEAGCKAAAKDFDCSVEVLQPPDGAGDQKRMLEECLNKELHGIAVSPINPANQADLLQQLAKATNYITHDADAPGSGRLAYIGMDNYAAGRMCGKLVKEAIPDGGEIVMFVGRLGQLNADLRRQGIIDELLNRSSDPTRRDPNGQVIKSDDSKYVILDTRTDNLDSALQKSQAEDAIVKYPDLKCMVGLFADNPPAILEALDGAGKLGKIQVVGFDEADGTLQGIQDGNCFGTVVQDPYNYGYKSVELLAALARGNRDMLPTNDDKFIDIPARVIKKENVDEFWTRLKELVGG